MQGQAIVAATGLCGIVVADGDFQVFEDDSPCLHLVGKLASQPFEAVDADVLQAIESHQDFHQVTEMQVFPEAQPPGSKKALRAGAERLLDSALHL